jgi:hypothetical protein
VADNTVLNQTNVGSAGDTIRDLARQSGAVKTQVVQLDLGGPATNAENLTTAGPGAMANALPITRAGDDPSDPALIRIVDLLTRLFPNPDSIFSPFQELTQALQSIQALLASPPLPAGATQLTGQTAGNAQNCIVTFPAVPGRTIYLTGLQAGGLGATTAAQQFVQVAGIAGGTCSWAIGVPAGVTVSVPSMVVPFTPPLIASGPNVAVVSTLFSFGAGNVGQSLTAWGYMI